LRWSALESEYPGALELPRCALHSVGGETLDPTMLGFLETDYSEVLVDELVGAALSHRYALRTRRILGRLSHDHAEHIVPSAAWRLLQKDVDYEANRGMPELLERLGLHRTLGQLAAEALASSEPEISKVGEGYVRAVESAGLGTRL
jgi:hypothetical protein